MNGVSVESLVLPKVSNLPLALSTIWIFIVAYALVIVEEFTLLRKSIPVMISAGIIWLIIAWIAKDYHLADTVQLALHKTLIDFTELLLFVLVSMTYINVLQDRKVFDVLSSKLINLRLSYRQLFWITGFLSFFISPFADNLTTALVMGTIVLSVGKSSPKFVALSCINLVIAANAGGAFSPFGDLTTLMVWQSGTLPFASFLKLFLPSLINFVIPALCLHFALPKGRPRAEHSRATFERGGIIVILLFLLTILTSLLIHNIFHLPPIIGMMLGLGYLQIFGFYLKKHQLRQASYPDDQLFDVLDYIKQTDWDTFLFFYGVILSIGGLATLGYLESLSSTLYLDWGKELPTAFQATPANVIIGLLSAVVDNIPVMFAVLTMHPNLSEGQWLLVTLTAGVGGSLLSVGSAAGIALMGQTGGIYTFFSHLKWIWAIALGYAASIAFHLWWNAHLF